ncbi:MAG: response regulator transcription factor [Pseudomonadota bacterium]
MRLLLIEDDLALRLQLEAALRDARYIVDVAADGEEGTYLGETGEYGAIVLDLGLPFIDGISLLGNWREQGLITPVLILTARNSWRDKVHGLRRGADDYLTKPFEMEELFARLEALIRRSHGHGSSAVTIGALEIDLAMRSVTNHGRHIPLTPNEYRTLAYLALNKGRVISKSELTEHIYAQDFGRDSNVIEVMMARLRKKIGANCIKTHRGHGYFVG